MKPVTFTWKRIAMHPYFSLFCVVMILVVLPLYGGAAAMVGCASVLSLYVFVTPESFRTRRGSLVPAVCLLLAMWVVAGVSAVVALMRFL